MNPHNDNASMADSTRTESAQKTVKASTKKRGRPSKVDKFRQLEPKFWDNGTAPVYINERIKDFDRARDVNAYHLWLEWQVRE